MLDSIYSLQRCADAPQVTDLYQYEPYGAVIFSNTAESNRWRFAQGYYDNAPKLYKFGQHLYGHARHAAASARLVYLPV